MHPVGMHRVERGDAVTFDGVDQLVVFTADGDAARKLYCDHLGFSVASREDVDGSGWGALWRLPDIPDRLRVTLLDKPGSKGGRLRLVELPGMGQSSRQRRFMDAGLFAFDFYVRDLWGLWEELRADGFEFKSEPLTYAMPGASSEILECLMAGPQGIWHSFIQYLPGRHRCLLASQPDQRVSEVVAVVQIVDDVERTLDVAVGGLGGQVYYDDVFGGPAIDRIVGLPPGSSFRVALVRGPGSRNARIELMRSVDGALSGRSAAAPVLLSIRTSDLDEQLAALRVTGCRLLQGPVAVAATFVGGSVRAAYLELDSNIHLELVEQAG